MYYELRTDSRRSKLKAQTQLRCDKVADIPQFSPRPTASYGRRSVHEPTGSRLPFRLSRRVR